MDDKTKKIYEFEDFQFDITEQILMRGGEVASLTPKVFDLLVVLVENHGHLLTKDELIKTLWADSFVEEANLNVTVSALRKVLGEKPNEHRFIETVPRRGYRFVAEVREIADENPNENIKDTDQSFTEAKTLSIETPAKTCPKCRKVYYDETLNFCLDDGETLTVETYSTKKTFSIPFQNNSKLFLLFGGILIAAMAGILIWKYSFQVEKTGVSEIRTIAVLPFKPLADNQSDEALEIGMADALITKLSGIEQITVRPTSSISKYAETNPDPVAAGRELQVEAVLDGKIQRSENKIRVTVQLLRVNDGATLWAETFDDYFTNIFAVQDSISEKMTASLALKISGQEKELFAKRYTENTEAYQLFLKGRYFHEKISVEGSKRAIEFYQAAVAKDPDYALAYAWMVGALIHLGKLNIDGEENLQKARNAAAKSVILDPNLPDAHEAMATVMDSLDWNWSEAEKEYLEAIELDSKNADAHYSYSIFLSRFKRHDEAIREIETAQRLNPTAMYIQNQFIQALFRARRFDEAVTQAQKAVESKPDNATAYYFLVKLFIRQSKIEEAENALKMYYQVNPTGSDYYRALFYLHAGRKSEGEKLLRGMTGKFNESDNYTVYAKYYVLLGEKENALDFLEKAYQRREVHLLTLAVDSDWDDLRSEPRFQDLLKRIGLPL